MIKNNIQRVAGVFAFVFALASCTAPALLTQQPNTPLPTNFNKEQDTTTAPTLNWRQVFTDVHLQALIDTALVNNQELRSTLQEIEIARSEIRMRQGEILPTGGVRGGIGVEKVGRYTSQGAGDASTNIKGSKAVPDILPDYTGAVYAHWEIDAFQKLHTAKQAAVTRYLASVQGKNLVVTSLVAEIANAYYELVALDNQLANVRQSIALQQRSLEVIKIQKQGARANELGVQKFNAEVLKSESLEFDILQQIKEGENKINLLLGRYPQPVVRDTTEFLSTSLPVITSGMPSLLLENRPDIKQAELQLQAAKLDVKVARTAFYPSFGITAAAGLQAFNPAYLVTLPESVLFSLAGDVAAPLINRNGIKAAYSAANAVQLQSMYNYERIILTSFLEVSTQLSAVDNLQKSYGFKLQQVQALTKSIEYANDLFRAARADYLEVLTTQRDALDARLELAENKKAQYNAVINLYRSLGGGWQ